MLQLMLLRHAKSSWDNPDPDDIDRPLLERGKQMAKALGSEMRELGLLPGLAICSPAKRARQTWEIVSAQLETSPRTMIDEAIYDFGDGERLLKFVRQQTKTSNPLILIGHNPSLEKLARRLVNAGDREARDRLDHKFGTAALVVIHFNVPSWQDIVEGGTLIHFIRPKHVADEVQSARPKAK